MWPTGSQDFFSVLKENILLVGFLLSGSYPPTASSCPFSVTQVKCGH